MRVPAILFALFAAVVLSFAFGCSGEKQEQTENKEEDRKANAMVAKPLGNPEDKLAREAAEILVKKFKTELRSELMAAMSQSGAAGAIEICSQKAPQMAKDLSVGGWSIRRTSLMNRNPGNYPTGPEGQFLQRFASDSTKSVQVTWDFTGDTKVYRYFEAIRLDGMCTACHGKTEEMDEDVVAKLQQLYPNDRAVGFKSGDLRGMFAVSAIWPEGKAEAEKLVAAAH